MSMPYWPAIGISSGPNTSFGSCYLYNYDPSAAGVLTLGPNLTINHTGWQASLNTSSFGRSGSGLVNAGTINANLSGGNFSIQGAGSFTNQGVINVSNGDTVSITSIFSNPGTLNANGGNIQVTAAETSGGTATIYGTSQIPRLPFTARGFSLPRLLLNFYALAT